MKPLNLSILTVFISFLCIPQLIFSQGDTNIVDNQGRKQGYWIFFGEDRPEKGYAANCKIEEGSFKDGRKNGKWVKYHKDPCNMQRLEGTYENGRPKGAYVKIDPEGGKEVGNFVNGKQIGEFKIISSDGVVLQEKTFDEEGKTDGKIIYRYPDGQIELEAERKNGVATGREIRYWPNGDVKKITTYNDDGSVASSESLERVNPPKNTVKITNSKLPPPAKKGKRRDGKPFDPNGYNKLYNENDELYMDGEFKNGRIRDGKVYIYDSDGLLLNIEVWKKGLYHSDGQLDK